MAEPSLSLYPTGRARCTRCRLPEWTHDMWRCEPYHMEYVGDDELRRDVVLRELNQGALAGLSTRVTEHAADLVLAALNRYDAWRGEGADPAARAIELEAQNAALRARLAETGETDE